MSLIFVSSSQELDAALRLASGGEQIVLAPGHYGDLTMITKGQDDFRYSDTVTIVSEDPANPASFSSVDVREAANVTFDSILFDYEFEAGDQIYSRPFNFMESENITIRNSTFDGDVAENVSTFDDGYGFAIGLSVRESSGTVIENNEFHTFHRGLSVAQGEDVLVKGNEVHSIRMDGMNFAEIQGITIEDNHIHDFKGSIGSVDHRDMIQFWTNGTDSPSTDIIIRNNLLDIGEGTFTQSIFMRNDMVDRGFAGDEMFYRNVSITDNVIINGHTHGINVGETDGLVIKSNTVLHNDGDTPDGVDAGVEIPVIRVAEPSRNVTITQNATSSIDGWTGQSGWQVTQNAFVQDQDPDAAGYYEDVFIGSSLQYVDGKNLYIAAPDGLLHQLDAGAALTLKTGTDANLEARFDVEMPETGAATRVFDGTLAVTGSGALPAGTQFNWDFGDGTTASGAVVEHAFPAGGTYAVSLTVTLPDGTQDTTVTPVEVAGSQILSMTDQGGFWAHENGETQWISLSAADADGLDLGQSGVTARIDHEHFAKLLHTEEFDVSFTLEADSSDSSGEIFRIHNSLLARVDGNGILSVTAYKAGGGTVALSGVGVDLSDGAQHDVSFGLKDGVIELLIDGVSVGSAAFEGTLKDLDGRDLDFGNPWGAQNFDGTLTSFSVTQNASGYDDAASTVPSVSPFVAEPLPEVAPAPLPAEEDAAPVLNLLMEDSIQLSETGIAASVDRELITDLVDSDQFTIDMILGDASGDTSGEVFRLHGSLLVEVQSSGHLQVRAFTDEGTVRLKSETPLFSNDSEHQISIDLQDSVLSLTIDNQPQGAVELPTAGLAGRGNHDLVFGNPWNRDNYEGEIQAFQITTVSESGTQVQDISDLLQQTRAPDGMLPSSEIFTQLNSASSTSKAEPTEMSSYLTDADGMTHVSSVIDRLDAESQNELGLNGDY